ncbi:MAG: SYNERG-CTERM sorting domain-containing protein, partial [Fretibacterium sp.]|nr:SYNERG-CTERM sorting domain-containing protein [Fretibacterium sp.]
GAYDTLEGGKGQSDDPEDSGRVYYIQISGLPNTLRKVGQTASLFAYGYDIHGNVINRNVSVTWKSSNTGVAYFDSETSGNIFIRNLGKTTISAATSSGLEDSVELEVTDETSYTNIHAGVWQRLGYYNTELSAQGMALTFADADPASVTASAFQSDFKKQWNSTASQVTTLTNASEVNFYSRPARAGDIRPGVNVAVTGREKGEVLPMEYTWTYSYDELSELLNRSVTTPPTAEELGKVLTIDFETFSGASVPVLVGGAAPQAGAALCSAQVGVSAVDAATTEAFSINKSSNGVAIHLTAYLANVQDTNNTGAQLVQRLLVVPDGVADNGISGTMWMSKKAESSSNNGDGSGNENGGGGGGGGGCRATGLGLAVLLLALPLLAQRKR